jgi:beta-lactamase regulating signal transducer with metallopeptidase domain
VSWLEIPAAALAWWNPLFWWIRGRIRHYAELSCDAWAVWAYPADRRLFAEALIDMQARTRRVSPRQSSGLP